MYWKIIKQHILYAETQEHTCTDERTEREREPVPTKAYRQSSLTRTQRHRWPARQAA